MLNAFMEPEEEKVYVFAEYYDLDDNMMKDRSQGLAILTYDYDGKRTNSSYFGWKKEIKKQIGVDDKGRIGGAGYVALHNVQRTADGHFYAIGELYKKTASALGITASVLSGLSGSTSNVSMAKMVVMDMVAFEFNPDMSLNSVKRFKKKKSNVNLPAGMLYNSPAAIANYMRATGDFDYAYTSISKDKSSFFSTYISRQTKKESTKKSKRKFYLGVISHTDGDVNYQTDRVDLTTESNLIKVFEAKPGYVMLAEYFRRKKKLVMRLEKINY